MGKNIFPLVIFVLLFFTYCSDSTSPTSPSDNPDWVNALIKKYESEPVGNPPQSIWRYTYRGQTVYFVPAQCCDQFSILYDVEGNILCAPDGGFTGQGDGKCPDFFKNRKDEKLIWKDNRRQ